MKYIKYLLVSSSIIFFNTAFATVDDPRSKQVTIPFQNEQILDEHGLSFTYEKPVICLFTSTDSSFEKRAKQKNKDTLDAARPSSQHVRIEPNKDNAKKMIKIALDYDGRVMYTGVTTRYTSVTSDVINGDIPTASCWYAP